MQRVATSSSCTGTGKYHRWRRMCNVPLPPVSPSSVVNQDSVTSPLANPLANSQHQLNISTPPSSPVQGSNETLPSPTPSDVFENSDDDPDYVPSEASSVEISDQAKETTNIYDSLDSESEPERGKENSIQQKKIIIIENILIAGPSSDAKLSTTSNSINTNAGAEQNSFKKKKSYEKDYCYFCEEWVLNFARHIFRNHGTEFEVQKIASYPVKSKERKDLITAIRKKGNFIENNESGKPIKKPSINTKTLPCKFCFGFYSSKSLWKHTKRCTHATGSYTQSEAHNFIVRNLKIDEKLRELVFPRMRADDISLVAKKDPLICAFGSRYLKIHREKHFINVVSRKMRELSRLLIETRKLDPSIKSLFDVLKPEKYDTLMNATKNVAKYDCEKEFYTSPTFAINMGTNLKQCCEIAIMNVLKKKEVFSTTSASQTENSLQTLIKLIESHWKFDISSQASNDLNLKKWNKVSLLPLADDLKLLKDFLVSTGNDAQRKLEGENPGADSYLTLLETIYCRTILLNRRRPGELQRLFLRTYNLEIGLKNYEEFEEVLSTTEKVLIKNFKRIVIRGKRGRGVPVLFSTDVQNHLNTLIKVREKFVSQSNLYLFGNPGTSQPIHGYKILKKYAVKCGARNPDAITCTKLRKHLATLTQLFNMSENDMEQLATFMGHTLSVHRQNYRLPDDVYQTAKISKLLMLMEKGEAGQFKGKSLDDIKIDMNEDLLYTNENNKDNERDELDDANIQGDNEDDLPISETVGQQGNADKMTAEVLENVTDEKVIKSKKICNKEDKTDFNEKPNKCGKRRILVPWTEEQKAIVRKYFVKHIKSKQPPKRFECEELIAKYQEILHNKNWLKIKVFVQNIYTKNK